MFYNTNVDGRGYIESSVKLEKDMLVMIDDNIYNSDKEVFKVLDVNEDKNKVEMKFQKVVVLDLSDDGNYEIGGKVYLFSGRLSKNQMLLVGDKVGKVLEIKKSSVKGEADSVVMAWEEFITVKSKYRVYKVDKVDRKIKEVHGMYDTYGDALGEVIKMRNFKGYEGYFHM